VSLVPGCKFHNILVLVCIGIITACDDSQPGYVPENNVVACDVDNAGLKLPAGFCAGVVADSLGFIRHLAVNSNGDIYVALRNTRLNLGGILALRDSDKDGKMDIIEKINDIPGMGIAIRNDILYFASDTDVYRYQLTSGRLIPQLPPEIIVRDLPVQDMHAGKTFAIDSSNRIYVNIGAMTNACLPSDQAGQKSARDPCEELKKHAGIWRFSLDHFNQTQENDGYHYAVGIRNAYAIDWHPLYKQLYAVQHGRDQLHENWPELYSAKDGARLPAEEFFLINDAGVYGWPYCYYDPIQDKRVLAPEYGGDGKQIGRCGKYPQPLVAFPAHYGPNDMKFYISNQFPQHYRNGAFIAFHGSYNRGEFGQAGYQVVFVPFKDGYPSGPWEVFIDGFAGTGEVKIPEDADYRPTGLALGPDGSLYISDSVQGRIWRIIYRGERH
jgi:glucose/arabinose dehydrogenase